MQYCFFECTDQTIGHNRLEQRCNLFVPWKFSRVNKIFTFCHRTNTRFNVSLISPVHSLLEGMKKMLLASQNCFVSHSLSSRYLLNWSAKATATGASPYIDVKHPIPVWKAEQPQQGNNQRDHSSQWPIDIQYVCDWEKNPNPNLPQ